MDRIAKWTLAMGAAALVGLVAPALGVAQEEEDRCRCDDRYSFSWGGPDSRVFAFGGMHRARIGVSLGGPEQEDWDQVGAYVREVQEDSPAERAGLREGDVITAVDGHDLMDPLSGSRERRIDPDDSLPIQRLMSLASAWDEGDEVEITYERDGTERTATMEAEELAMMWDVEPLRVRMHELGENMRDLAPRIRAQMEQSRDHMDRALRRAPVVSFRGSDGEGRVFSLGEFGFGGMELRELNPDMGRYFGADEGVLVMDVDEDSDLGLQPGDVILSIDGRAVDSPRDVYRILRSYEDDEVVRIEIMRDRNRMEVEGTH